MLAYRMSILCFFIILVLGFVLLYIGFRLAIKGRAIMYGICFSLGFLLIIMDVFWFLFLVDQPHDYIRGPIINMIYFLYNK